MDWRDGLIAGLILTIIILGIFGFWMASNNSEYRVLLEKVNSEKVTQEKEYQKLSNSYEQLSHEYNDLSRDFKDVEKSYNELKETYKDYSSYRLPKDITPAPALSDIGFLITKDSLLLQYSGLNISIVSDTKSMQPIISSGHTIITTTNFNKNTLQVGDIISYNASWSNLLVTHRIVGVKTENGGVCYEVQGDNNQYPDPECVKPSKVSDLVIGIIFNKNNQGYPTCPAGTAGVAIDGKLACVSEKVDPGIYTTSQPLEGGVKFKFCSETDSSKPYTVIKPDGNVYCYSNVP